MTLQTGPAESTALGLPGDGAGGHSSRLILLPLHGDGSERAADLWTGAMVSSLGVARHVWAPSGKVAIVAAEDGWLRVIDLQGRTRAEAAMHGSASAAASAAAAAAAASAEGFRTGDDVDPRTRVDRVLRGHDLADARQTLMSNASLDRRERTAVLMRQSLAWSRGSGSTNGGSGGNTAIRGIVAWDEGTILSAGFDRTIRLSYIQEQL